MDKSGVLVHLSALRNYMKLLTHLIYISVSMWGSLGNACNKSNLGIYANGSTQDKNVVGNN